MKHQINIWRATLCVLIAFSILSPPTFASEETKSTTVEEVTVASGNPIMIIRCRFDDSEGEDEFTSSSSKKTNSSKIIETACIEGYVLQDGKCVPNCGFGFRFDTDKGGCVPDCNAISGSEDNYVYNTSTGICDCDVPMSTVISEVSCESFCFSDRFEAGLKSNSPSKAPEENDCRTMYCPDDAFGEERFGPFVYSAEEEACYTACFDGELKIDVPFIDCGNPDSETGHVEIEVCFTSADPINNPLIEGQSVPFEDIQNCFGSEGEVLLDVLGSSPDDDGDTPDDDGESYYFDDAVVEDGKLCVKFFVDPTAPVLINFTNSAPVVIPTCFDDPCGCNNPNIRNSAGEVELFFDQLTNLQGLVPGAIVRLEANNNPPGFVDAEGDPIMVGTLLGTVDMSGNFEYTFYRASGQKADVVLNILENGTFTTLLTQNFVSSTACVSTNCVAIPTMGQWGLLILALLLSSLGLVFMSRRRMA